MAGICEGRVVVVTGAGRGIGRGHAIEFARQGARVVVNDLGAEPDGEGRSEGPAGEVVDLIREMGGEAVANGDDVSDWAAAEGLVKTAVATWGRLDVLVNNAGILRDRMLVSMQEDEFDAVMRVHVKGTFAPMHHAAVYWRERSKAGETNDARVINTSSAAGLFGNVGQTNYAAAKSAIATMSRVAAAELKRYGVTVNAIAPIARTRMTESLFPDAMAAPAAGFDAMDPENIAPIVVWLGSPESAHVTGQVFEIAGNKLSVAEGWRHGPEAETDGRWDPAQLRPIVDDIVARANPGERVIGAR